MNDMLKTQLQQTGECRVVGLTVLEIADLVDRLGIDPRVARIDQRGWLYVSEDMLMGGRQVVLR